MARQEDEATLRAREAEKKTERKNYTYRLRIYLAELFAKVCQEKGVQPVTLIEHWVEEYVRSYEDKFGPNILKEIDEIIEAKKNGERLSREKQQGKGKQRKGKRN